MTTETTGRRICGAKTRAGGTCANSAVNTSAKGRCRMHGGKKKLGIVTHQTHGIYTKHMSPEELKTIEEMELGKVDQELQLCRIRLQRALAAEELSAGAPELDSRKETTPMPAPGGDGIVMPPSLEIVFKRRDYNGLIDKLMARIESLERTRSDLAKAGAAGLGVGEEPVTEVRVTVQIPKAASAA